MTKGGEKGLIAKIYKKNLRGMRKFYIMILILMSEDCCGDERNVLQSMRGFLLLLLMNRVNVS